MNEDTARLICGLLDARLPERERLRLEVQLESDAAARQLYLQMVDQEIELSCLVAPADTEKVVSLAAARSEPRRTRWLLAAAAALALLAALWMVLRPRETVRPVVDGIATTWAADFESGSAPGWKGELVTTGLPPGSLYALRAAPERSADGVVYHIALPADWGAGLFALTARSTLHVTYRISRPTGMDVLMHTFSADLVPRRPSMFRLTGAQFPGAAGVWQTASIPFALFVQKIPDPATGTLTFSGGPPRDGEVVAALSFSQPHEFDLVIDRIWITPDGTGTETIRTLP
jgi:hypothetical protein